MATRWSNDQKADALDMLRNGDTLADTHRATGIPKQTISRWATRAGIDVVRPRQNIERAQQANENRWAELRETVANEAGGTARRILAIITAALDAGELEVKSVHQAKDAATTMAILADKAQLLTGEATSRHEHVAPERTPEQEEQLAEVLTLMQGAA